MMEDSRTGAQADEPGSADANVDPRSKYPEPPFQEQTQAWPGLAGEMTPRPDHGETSYVGSGRLKGRKALITGGDSGMGRGAAIACAREGADVAGFDSAADQRRRFGAEVHTLRQHDGIRPARATCGARLHLRAAGRTHKRAGSDAIPLCLNSWERSRSHALDARMNHHLLPRECSPPFLAASPPRSASSSIELEPPI
jgi:hypothetical protein